MNAIPLSALDLLIAASLLVVNGVLSIVLQLRLERALLISALRMVVQLTLVVHRMAGWLSSTLISGRSDRNSEQVKSSDACSQSKALIT